MKNSSYLFGFLLKMASLIACTITALYLKHWWIILFSALFWMVDIPDIKDETKTKKRGK